MIFDMNDIPKTIAVTTDTVYADFVANSRGHWPQYRAAFRGKIPELKPGQAHKFVSNWIDRFFERTDSSDPCLVEKLIDSAIQDQKLNGLGLVATAILAIRRKQFSKAAELAERAYAGDQHEVFAQRIFLAAGEEKQDLQLEIDDWLSDRFCNNPFTDLEIIQSGDLYTCCAAWMPAHIGSAHDDTTDHWQAARAQELRRSIIDGDFSYCSRLSCPKIAKRTLPLRADIKDQNLRDQIELHGSAEAPAPDRVLLSYDISCNLSCPSCRLKTISFGGKAAAKLDDFYDDRIAPLISSAGLIKITGSGDPFGSNHFRHVLQELTAEKADRARLQLQTNGVLFDERAWNDLSLEGHVKSVWISVDAINSETYAELRRGGDFERLKKNLRFLGEKRKQGCFEEYRLDFVVQAGNFRQMPDYVDMARDFGADGVHFLMLRNWGTFTPKQYQDLAVTFEDHPEYEEFLDVLADPRLGESFVDLGNLAPLREPKKSAPRKIYRTDAPPVGNSDDVKVLLVLGTRRTGSNYLFGCMDKLTDVYTLREVFNPAGAFGLNNRSNTGFRHFSTIIGRKIDSDRDKELTSYLRSDPVDAIFQLRRLAAGMGCNTVALKIFEDQIDPDILFDKILSDPAVVPIILKRKMLSSYISLIKAFEAKSWIGGDLTDIRPLVDLDKFREWQVQIRAWYNLIDDALRKHKKHAVNLHYESITNALPKETLDSLVVQLQEHGVFLETASIDFPPPTVRQDQTTDTLKRIGNGDEIHSELKRRGLFSDAMSYP